MTDFKKELIEVAGDLADSKHTVKQRLQMKNDKPKRNLLVAPVMVMALCIMGFMLWLLPNKTEQQQANDLFNNEHLFEYYKSAELMSGFYDVKEDDQDSLNEAVFERFQNTIALQQYAKSKKLTYTEEQYEAQEQLIIQAFNEENTPIYNEFFSLSELTEKQYEQYVKPILIENTIYAQQLNNKLLEENPKLLKDFVLYYTESLANDYLKANFEPELEIARDHFQVPKTIHGASSSKSGTIAAIEGKMVYFIQNATYQEIEEMTAQELHALQEQRLKAWLINYDDVALQVGDFVRVSVDRTVTSYDQQLTNGIAEDLEVVISASEATVPEIYLTAEQESYWKQETHQEKWESQQLESNSLTPRYIVHLSEKAYTIFQNKDNNFFLVPHGDQTIAKLSKEQTKKMDSWLRSFVTK
ncbi:hypothetical protein MKX47_12690 [Solibacillus sp. FSL R7-0668]|uniref:hypothetical protein n=1 Tax=Solibacillus sp. FSL R7-0668 TaxID=2921688 RepID=UPI0030F900DA